MWTRYHIEFLIFCTCLFIISFVSFTAYACAGKRWSNKNNGMQFETREQTIRRLFKEIEERETKLGRSYIVHVIVNSKDPLPELEWNPDVDYYLFYPNGAPVKSPHTSKIHFDLMIHIDATDITFYKGKCVGYPLGPYIKPCPICHGFGEL